MRRLLLCLVLATAWLQNNSAGAAEGEERYCRVSAKKFKPEQFAWCEVYARNAFETIPKAIEKAIGDMQGTMAENSKAITGQTDACTGGKNALLGVTSESDAKLATAETGLQDIDRLLGKTKGDLEKNEKQLKKTRGHYDWYIQCRTRADRLKQEFQCRNSEAGNPCEDCENNTYTGELEKTFGGEMRGRSPEQLKEIDEFIKSAQAEHAKTLAQVKSLDSHVRAALRDAGTGRQQIKNARMSINSGKSLDCGSLAKPQVFPGEMPAAVLPATASAAPQVSVGPPSPPGDQPQSEPNSLLNPDDFRILSEDGKPIRLDVVDDSPLIPSLAPSTGPLFREVPPTEPLAVNPISGEVVNSKKNPFGGEPYDRNRNPFGGEPNDPNRNPFGGRVTGPTDNPFRDEEILRLPSSHMLAAAGGTESIPVEVIKQEECAGLGPCVPASTLKGPLGGGPATSRLAQQYCSSLGGSWKSGKDPQFGDIFYCAKPK